jgi:hypothetical protein
MARHVFQYDRWDPQIGCFLGDPFKLAPLEACLDRPAIADEAGLGSISRSATGVRYNNQTGMTAASVEPPYVAAVGNNRGYVYTNGGNNNNIYNNMNHNNNINNNNNSNNNNSGGYNYYGSSDPAVSADHVSVVRVYNADGSEVKYS